MKRTLRSACALLAMLSLADQVKAQDRARYEKMIARHAKANLVPEALVHRLIVRESKYNPELIGHGGTIGLMQIKLATARGVGYTGDAEGLRDPEINLTWGVKYLAGAYRAAGGDYDRAIRYFAGGFYYVAKQQRLDHLKQGKADFSAAPPKIVAVEGSPTEAAKPEEQAAAPADDVKVEEAAARPAEAPVKLVPAPAKLKVAKKKLADAKVPRPRAPVPGGANGAKPR